MALRRFDLEAGGDGFSFRPETEEKIAFWLGKYPAEKKRSAVIPLLWLAQKDNAGWLSEPAMREVADRLEMPYIRVYEVATFYTMFRLQPVGQYHVQLCGTTPCQLRGAEQLKDVCNELIGGQMFVTDDKRLSWEEVECLGACVNAPMVQINDDYYEDLTPDSFREILTKLQNGVVPEHGPQVDRINSAPEGGATTLTTADLFDGSRNSIQVLPNLPVEEAEEAAEAGPSKTTLIGESKPEPARGTKPEAVEIGDGDGDDLKRIKGIGPVNEDALNALGVFKFSQIATLGQLRTLIG